MEWNGMNFEVQWKDDSSSGLTFHKHLPDDTKLYIMLCANYVARSHRKALESISPLNLSNQSMWRSTMKSTHS